MWLKEKKMWIAIVLLLVVIGLVIAWIAGAFWFCMELSYFIGFRTKLR